MKQLIWQTTPARCSLSNRKANPIFDEAAKGKPMYHNRHVKFHNPDLDLAKLSIEPTALTTELPPHIAPY